MTTGKRRIPINHVVNADEHLEASSREQATAAPPEQAGPATAAPAATPPAGEPLGRCGECRDAVPEPDEASAEREGPAVEHGGSAQREAPIVEAEAPTEPDTLAAERDRLAEERDRLAEERDRLAEERDALTDTLLRLRAEFDNFRKRMSRELIEAKERARGDLLGELLPVLDNLDRALDAAEHHDERKVLAGVRMTRDMFVDLLRRSGVEEIETVGKSFDPTVHEAIAVQPAPDAEGLVAAVLERGYRQGDRVLRPARVIVSAGPAGSEEEADLAGGK